MIYRSTALLTALWLFSATPAQAQDVETLQQEVAKLQQQLDSSKATSSHLRGRLQRAIAVSKSRQKQLTSATTTRDELRGRLGRAIAVSKTRQAKLTSTTATSSELRSRLGRAIAVSKSRQAKLTSATATSSELRGRLGRAIAVSKSRQASLTSATATSRELRGRLGRAIAVSKTRQASLTSATATSRELRGRLGRAIAVSKSRQASLTSATASSSDLRGRLRRAIAFSKSKDAVDSDADWASDVGNTLSSSVGDLDGVEVTINSNNTVNVRVGNVGLFSTGSTNLSAEGRSIMGSIASQLQAQPDTNITIIGHSDNIPVGQSSRFTDNTELSFERASSTLAYLRSVGVPADQLSAAGYGEFYPIESNDTVEGRVSNRRVDVLLSPK